MATKSQRKSDKQRRKRQKERSRQKRRAELQRKQGTVLGANARHRRRLAQQTPQAWSGETPEDVAVFDDSVFQTLSTELANQVSAIRQALQYACESRGDEALEQTVAIARSSPVSEWRLFIRGLVPWMANDFASAKEAWKRLDPARRPGRIAIAMTTALRSELEQLPRPAPERESSNEVSTDSLIQLDDQLLYHAKLLRRIRFDRAAVRIAESNALVPEESNKLVLGPRKIRWLQDFAAEFGTTEPDLVAALQRTALGRAFAQDYGDLFDTAARVFPGPPHDRRNRLFTFLYYVRFTNDHSAEQKAERSLEEYLTRDLPQNKELAEPLKKAIASQIHLHEATALIQSAGGGMLKFLFDEPPDERAIKRSLKASVRAYPANRDAYETHAEWLHSKLENERLTKKERAPLVRQLAQVMKDWSRGLPDDSEPRLWLVDHLLEDEQTDQAKPHVDWLAAARQDDPRVRAAPWKWQLLDAMRLCRRKAWLHEVPARLEEAAAKWPSWLPKQWLPYLRAAWLLRSGRTEQFEQQRQKLCEESGLARDSLADACMMLGAAQRLRVPAADLKPLRVPVDTAVNNLNKLPYEELLEVCGFFWDLQRTELLYPAYRMHGGKFGREFLARLTSNPSLALDYVDDKRVQSAVLLCSEHRFWSDGYELRLPAWYAKPAIEQHPMFAAAKLNAFIQLSSHWRCDQFKELGPMLREAAQTQRDPFFRFWFVSLADKLDDVLAKQSSGGWRFGFGDGSFRQMFGPDDNDFDYDPECDCPDCQAAKRAHQASW